MLTTQSPDPHERRPFLLLRPVIALWQWLFPPTVAHRDRQSVKARVIAGIAIVAVCVGMVATVLLNGKKWYDGYQTWEANRKIKKADAFEKQERLLEAWIQANEAYKLDPENPNVIRTLARYYTARKQKEAIDLLDRLERMGVLTDDDRLLRIQALANNNEDKAAQAKIEEVLRQSPPSARMVEIADHVLLRLGRREQLLGILRSYVERKPDDLQIRYMLATREVQFGSQREVAEGLSLLWALAEDRGKTGLDALKFLDQQTLAAEQESKLVGLLEKHPLAGEEERIAVLRRQVAMEPGRKTGIVEKALRDRKSATREDLVPLARWLTQEGEHERLLAFLKLEMVQDYPPLLEQYLNALTLANRLDDLEKLVKNPRTRITSAERAFYRAHLAFIRKQPQDEVNALLSDALESAKSSARPDMVMMIAQWAEKRGQTSLAEQAYHDAAVMGGSEKLARMGHEGMLRLTYANGNSKGYMDAARDTARHWPGNQAFLEQSLYASLLAGIEIETAIPMAQKLIDAKPDDTQRKLVMALALHRLMDTNAAVRQLNNISVRELKSAGKVAVLCGILHQGGGAAAAQAERIAAQIPEGTLMLPEERRFFLMAKGSPAGGLTPPSAGQP